VRWRGRHGSASSAAGATGALEASGLRVRYKNGALGVLDVALRVPAGQVVAMFGPNGAGKTTSVRACSGFLRIEGASVVAGRVHVDGRDLTGAEPHAFCRRGVFCIPERRKIFTQLTVGDNLSAVRFLPPRAERAAVHERIFALFPSLGEMLHRQAGRLSGGQQQMLAIARALVCQPRYLIIDEMSLGLHVSLIRPLFEAIRSVADSGTAVLVVDESTDVALDVADYCYVLRSGHVVDEGPPSRFRGSELIAAGYVGES
jgi:branched-chain amino acid transport system ATP-binding protein